MHKGIRFAFVGLRILGFAAAALACGSPAEEASDVPAPGAPADDPALAPGGGGGGDVKTPSGVVVPADGVAIVAPAAEIRIVQGQTAKLGVEVVRGSASAAARVPVRVDIHGLPKGLTAAALTIAGDQTKADIILTAAADTSTGHLAPELEATLVTSGKSATASAKLAVRGVPGTRDTSFGQPDGYAAASTGIRQSQIVAVLTQSTGKVVLVGACSAPVGKLCLQRFDEKGLLDPTFHAGPLAIVIPDVPTPAGSNPTIATAILDGDRIVVGTPQAIVRFASDGLPDGTFGAGGKITFAPPSGTFYTVTLTRGAGGALLMRGSWQTDVALLGMARFSASGALDTTFGTAGFARFPIHDCRALDVAADGSMLCSTTHVTKNAAQQYVQNPSIVAFTALGALDSAFGDAGFHDFDTTTALKVGSVEVLPVLQRRAAGTLAMPLFPGGAGGVRLAGVSTNGKSADVSLGPGGISPATPVPIYSRSVVSDAAGGFIFLQYGSGLRRLTAAGTPDAAFGANNIPDFGAGTEDGLDDRVLVHGIRTNLPGYYVARYWE